MTLQEFSTRIEGLTQADDINAVCEASDWQFTTLFHIDGPRSAIGYVLPFSIRAGRYRLAQIDGEREIYERLQ